ncbi:hypothetical protein LY78DRAFT_293867 [Colletotrichum sublineola]|nr:hypothetical protein LY78DRAFT_293867 [Colletotrichum sublineola]
MTTQEPCGTIDTTSTEEATNRVSIELDVYKRRLLEAGLLSHLLNSIRLTISLQHQIYRLSRLQGQKWTESCRFPIKIAQPSSYTATEASLASWHPHVWSSMSHVIGSGGMTACDSQDSITLQTMCRSQSDASPVHKSPAVEQRLYTSLDMAVCLLFEGPLHIVHLGIGKPPCRLLIMLLFSFLFSR